MLAYLPATQLVAAWEFSQSIKFTFLRAASRPHCSDVQIRVLSRWLPLYQLQNNVHSASLLRVLLPGELTSNHFSRRYMRLEQKDSSRANLYDIRMLWNLFLILLFVDEVRPPRTEFWIDKSAILEFKTEIRIECQMQCIKPTVKAISPVFP